MIKVSHEQLQAEREQEQAERQEREQFRQRYNPERLVNLLQGLTDSLVRADLLGDEKLEKLADLMPQYVPGAEYETGDKFGWNGHAYRVISGHTSEPHYRPDEIPALYERVAPPGVIQEWVQPTGAHDAPNLGDLRTHNDRVWESMRDGNTSEPGTDQWWTDVTDEHT